MMGVEKRSPKPDRSSGIGPAELRFVLAICQALAIVLTWRLWQVRIGSGDAPNLPIIDAGWAYAVQFDFGWLLLASLVVALIRPRAGMIWVPPWARNSS